jgi:excisionase family DNA binding protein
MRQERIEYLTISEAAELLHVTPWTIRRRVAQYGIPTFRGRDLREVLIRRSDLERWQGIRPISRRQVAGAASR